MTQKRSGDNARPCLSHLLVMNTGVNFAETLTILGKWYNTNTIHCCLKTHPSSQQSNGYNFMTKTRSEGTIQRSHTVIKV